MELLGPQQIKEIRISLGVSQADFGKLLGISRVAVNELENGKNSPSPTVREKLVKILKKEKSKGSNITSQINSVVVEHNLSNDDREIEYEFITYLRLLDKETRLKHLKGVYQDVTKSNHSQLAKTLKRFK